MTLGVRAGLLVMETAVLQAHADERAHPGGLTFSAGGGRGLDLVEDVEGAGEQLARDRDGGDLGAAAVDALGVEACERWLGLGRLGGFGEHPAHRRRALLICGGGGRQGRAAPSVLPSRQATGDTRAGSAIQRPGSPDADEAGGR
jgi:hypothetical protein